MPKLLFVVHGMGDHLPGWESALVRHLDACLAQYKPFKNESDPFRRRVSIQPITYDGVFDKTIAPWGRAHAELTKFATTNGVALNGTIGKLSMGALPAVTEGFFWETLLDPILYRGSPIVADEVRASVSKQFIDAWDDHLVRNTTTQPLDVSVLCHSLGTIVMSDVLAIVGEARKPEFMPFSAEKRKIHSLTTLANVTRLGPGVAIPIDSRTSCVRPTSAPAWQAGKQNYLKRMLDARHQFDPFVLFQRFQPTVPWGSRYALIDDLKHVHQANTHGFLHYLTHPKVHVPFFRAVLGADVISTVEEQQAILDFDDFFPPECQQAIDALRQKLAALIQGLPGTPGQFDEWVEMAIEFLNAVKGAANACSSLVEGLDHD